MATTPNDPPHIFKAKQAAAEQGLDLVTAFTALNLATEFYCQEPLAAAPAAPEQADVDKRRRILQNLRKRLRQVHEILAGGEVPNARKVKKARFITNLLLPSPLSTGSPQAEKAFASPVPMRRMAHTTPLDYLLSQFDFFIILRLSVLFLGLGCYFPGKLLGKVLRRRLPPGLPPRGAPSVLPGSLGGSRCRPA